MTARPPVAFATNATWWFAVPAAFLVGSYTWLAFDSGAWNLMDVVVHENGQYTLSQTVFYWSHFMREVGPDLMKAAFAAAAFSVRRRGPRNPVAAIAALSLVIIGFTASAFDHGIRSTLEDLAQFRTRDDVADYGSHWRFHFLSMFLFGLWAEALARWRLATAGADGPRRVVLRGTWTAFAVLSLVMLPTLEPLADPRFIGHQAREVLTNAIVVVPLLIAVVALASREQPVPPWSTSAAGLRSIGWPLVAVVIIVPGYLLATGVTGSVIASGQTSGGLAAMLAGHVFEHSLDYALIGLVVASLVAPRTEAGRAGHVADPSR